MTTAEDDFITYAAARWAGLVRSAIVLGCSLEDAHDLVQTSLMRCYIAWRKVAAADNRDAYVYRVLLNAHRDTRRRRWRGELPTDQLPDTGIADHTHRVVVADAINRALADLSPDHREVLVLRYYANLTEDETANLLNVPVGTVKSRHSRAVARLATSPHLTDLTEGSKP